MAGGDVKLYAAVALWAGPTYILPLVLITGLAGLALALMVRSASHYLKWYDVGGAASALLRLVPRWVREVAGAPYKLPLPGAESMEMDGGFR